MTTEEATAEARRRWGARWGRAWKVDHVEELLDQVYAHVAAGKASGEFRARQPMLYRVGRRLPDARAGSSRWRVEGSGDSWAAAFADADKYAAEDK